MAATVPLLRLLHVYQRHVCLVDQGGGLQRLTRLFLGKPGRRQLAQLVVDQRQKLLGGVRSPSSMALRIRVTSLMDPERNRPAALRQEAQSGDAAEDG